MIIKKPRFNTALLKREDWPFSVSEVTVAATIVEHEGKRVALFAIMHNFEIYALTAGLLKVGVKPLQQSGIWLKADKSDNYRPVEPFYQYVTDLYRKLSDNNVELNG